MLDYMRKICVESLAEYLVDRHFSEKDLFSLSQQTNKRLDHENKKMASRPH